MAIDDSTVSVAEKAQQDPHEPWFLIGVHLLTVELHQLTVFKADVFDSHEVTWW
jgi:hypothetical protein